MPGKGDVIHLDTLSQMPVPVLPVNVTMPIFDLPQRKRIPDIHHHNQADDLGRRLEVSEGIWHRGKLRNFQFRLKPICSDKALSWAQIMRTTLSESAAVATLVSLSRTLPI
jgi:hypothetical protein